MKNKRLIQFALPLAAALILIAFIFLFPNFSRRCELKAYDLKMRFGVRGQDITNLLKNSSISLLTGGKLL